MPSIVYYIRIQRDNLLICRVTLSHRYDDIEPMTAQLSERPSDVNAHSGHYPKTFNDYLLNAQDIIRKRNPDITQENEKDILDAIGPKAFYPDKPLQPKKGILLIHGLLDSCAIMSSLFDYYSQKGYFVKTLLLPGHGTTPSDLMRIRWQDWTDCTQLAIDTFREEVSELSVLGLSTGACLATYFALNKAPIDKLVLFAPAFALKTNAAWLIKVCQRVNGLFSSPIKKWVIQQNETIIGKYRSIAVNGVYQLMALMTQTTPRLLKEQLRQPHLMILSGDDETISNKKALACYTSQTHPDKQLLFFRNDDEPIEANNMTTLSSCIPEERILNFSHICLTVSPSHPLYGKHRIEDPNAYFGANTPANLINYHFERLSYNPYFDKMMAYIDSFLEKKTR